jgi:hypothetical protein
MDIAIELINELGIIRIGVQETVLLNSAAEAGLPHQNSAANCICISVARC